MRYINGMFPLSIFSDVIGLWCFYAFLCFYFQIFFSDKNLNFQELGISVHSITGGLKQFFTLLPVPLVPVKFYQQILDSMGEFCIRKTFVGFSCYSPISMQLIRSLVSHPYLQVDAGAAHQQTTVLSANHQMCQIFLTSSVPGTKEDKLDLFYTR